MNFFKKKYECFLITYFSGTLNIKHESSIALSQKIEGSASGFTCFSFYYSVVSMTVLKDEPDTAVC